jgi:hypothetical protein
MPPSPGRDLLLVAGRLPSFDAMIAHGGGGDAAYLVALAEIVANLCKEVDQLQQEPFPEKD